MGAILLLQLKNYRQNKGAFTQHNIPNSWLASPPRQEFWLGLLREIHDRALNGSETNNVAEHMTGSIRLYTYYHQVVTKAMARGEVIPNVQLIEAGKSAMHAFLDS